MDIDQILDHISVYENSLINELSLSTIQTLMTLYQKAIEYYSAFDNDRFTDFLNRMKILLKREDISAVLSSYEDENVRQEKDFQEKRNQSKKNDSVVTDKKVEQKVESQEESKEESKEEAKE